MNTPMVFIKLEKLCEFVSGGTPRKNIPKFFSGTIPWISGADISDDMIQTPRYYITEEAIQESATHKIPAENILLVTRTGVGKVAITTEEICISQDFTGIIHNSSKINLKYLYFFLKNSKRYFVDNQRGATIKGVTRDVVKNLEIPIPHPSNPTKSLLIQAYIVSRIESLFTELSEARRLHEKIVADTNRLMESVLAEMYPTSEERLPEGWRFLSIPDICIVNPARPRNLPQSDETMTSFVPMAAVDDREGRITDLQARPFGEVKRGYTYFEENDVLFAKITPCMENGKAAVARGLISRFGFGSTEFHVLRPTNRILPEWIYYFVRREAFRQEAKTKFRGAVGQQRVPADFLETHLIPIPFPQNPEKSLDIQQQIITRVQMTASEVAEAQLGNTKTGALLNQMEQSILAQAFRGEL